MKLDKEQKRILKAIWPICLALSVVNPLVNWMMGKMDSWKDVLLSMAGFLALSFLFCAIYVLGAKIPTKDQ